MNFNRARIREKMDPGNFELVLAQELEKSSKEVGKSTEVEHKDAYELFETTAKIQNERLTSTQIDEVSSI